MRPPIYFCFLLLPLVVAWAPGVDSGAPSTGNHSTPLLGGQTPGHDSTPLQESPGFRNRTLPTHSSRRAADRELSPRGSRRRHRREKVKADDHPAEIMEGRETLTRMDLAELPLANKTFDLPQPRYHDTGCKMLTSKMHIYDGFCSSLEPVESVICEGHCFPEQDLPWFANYMKYWGRNKVIDYACEDDLVRRKSVELICSNGETRKIRVKVVRSCKCTRLTDPANQSLAKVPNTDEDEQSMDFAGTQKRKKHRRRKHKNKKRRKGQNKKKNGDKERKQKDKEGKKKKVTNIEESILADLIANNATSTTTTATPQP